MNKLSKKLLLPREYKFQSCAVYSLPFKENNQKRLKLLTMLNAILQDDRYREELNIIKKHMNITNDNIIELFIKYNLDVYAIDNAIYNSSAIPLILHLHNLVAQSWHQERQDTILKFLQEVNPRSIADIGFGVPSKYTRHLLAEKRSILTLCDFSEHAFKFAEVLLGIWDRNWASLINFRRMNMETGDYIGAYDLYMFIDSIEHVTDSARYLKKYVSLSPPSSQFILSLPIGPLIPMHYIAWSTTQEALAWLKQCDLMVENMREVRVNPGVDLFAEQYNYEYYNVIVRCKKIKDKSTEGGKFA